MAAEFTQRDRQCLMLVFKGSCVTFPWRERAKNASPSILKDPLALPFFFVVVVGLSLPLKADSHEYRRFKSPPRRSKTTQCESGGGSRRALCLPSAIKNEEDEEGERGGKDLYL